MRIDIGSSNEFLSPETIARFSREWDRAKGEKNMRARKSGTGDVIEISTSGASSNPTINEFLLQNGDVIFGNEMRQDLEEGK